MKLCIDPLSIKIVRSCPLTAPFSCNLHGLKVPDNAWRLISFIPSSPIVRSTYSSMFRGSSHISTRHPSSTSIRNNFPLQLWPNAHTSSQLKQSPFAVRAHYRHRLCRLRWSFEQGRRVGHPLNWSIRCSPRQMSESWMGFIDFGCREGLLKNF